MVTVNWVFALAPFLCIFGVFLHYVSDAQKFFVLQLRKGLIQADIPRIPGCCGTGSPVRTAWATVDRASHVQQAGEPAS